MTIKSIESKLSTSIVKVLLLVRDSQDILFFIFNSDSDIIWYMNYHIIWKRYVSFLIKFEHRLDDKDAKVHSWSRKSINDFEKRICSIQYVNYSIIVNEKEIKTVVYV